MSRGNPEYNRHHILFPERIWKDILGNAKEFRSAFVVKMRTTQHAKLHRRLDGLLGENVSEKDIDILKNSVNPVRLKNHPIELNKESINYLYHEILKEEE